MMTGGELAGGDLAQLRHHVGTSLIGTRAAGAKATAGRRVER
jgi:hypothetical protein